MTGADRGDAVHLSLLRERPMIAVMYVFQNGASVLAPAALGAVLAVGGSDRSSW